ncbi:hypothetical protein CCR75_001766 [Bremia lactucae]|uniref:Uncharacterized protein n=1 Tax=Bremia lactucae TaxID=4779 RepID=A0A976IH76_BRELC|nr:hypothetical protein CCR75_001766 [Bremia lactucae]
MANDVLAEQLATPKKLSKLLCHPEIRGHLGHFQIGGAGDAQWVWLFSSPSETHEVGDVHTYEVALLMWVRPRFACHWYSAFCKLDTQWLDLGWQISAEL